MHTGTTEFLKEANIMQNIEHENIVRMYGVVLDKDDLLMLVCRQVHWMLSKKNNYFKYM